MIEARPRLDASGNGELDAPVDDWTRGLQLYRPDLTNRDALLAFATSGACKEALVRDRHVVVVEPNRSVMSFDLYMGEFKAAGDARCSRRRLSVRWWIRSQRRD